MKTVRICKECATPLAADAPEGLCPQCLLKGAAETEADSASSARERTVGPELNQPFGGYQIHRLLGRGGMGAVYEAEEIESSRRVALKVLSHSLDSSDARKRFLREGRLSAAVNHPNSVYVFGTEEINGMPVITMELVAGGTLQEHVKRRGPLPIAEAVDAILQVIAGLEAAAAVGVLHRDVKPSNCFLVADGTVKVGDFGLSISTLARRETNLTVTGAFLGTPAYSSPEQLRGDELDVRSDIYAVGVTLYYLLTGTTPFKADNVVRLLSIVLERPAESPQKLRSEIPDELARVTLRCLAKQRSQRFTNYEELRQALFPFTSMAPTPAGLGIRLVAGVLDHAILGLTGMVTSLLFLQQNLATLSDPASLRSPTMRLLTFGVFVLGICFYALPEGLWGASLGKAICRLRVVGPDLKAPGVPRALLRALIFLLIPAVPAWLANSLFVKGSMLWSSWEIRLLQYSSFALILLMFSTARRKNGLAAWHDLASSTRVILKPAYQMRPTAAAISELPTTHEATPRIGPYHVLAVLDHSMDSELLLGYDACLFRKVWIRKLPEGVPAVATTLRTMGRGGRLRWLAGKRAPGQNWDAYEALTGQPLLGMLSESQRWKRVRFWLLDLADELNAGLKDQSLPAVLALDRVWITADSRAKLLDFAAPGVAQPARSAPPIQIAAKDEPPPIPFGSQDAQLFLKQVAVAAIEGRATDHEDMTGYSPKVPLPLHARNFLSELPKFPAFEGLIAQFRALLGKGAEISRARRLAMLAGCLLPVLFMFGVMSFGMIFYRAAMRQTPELNQLSACLMKLRSLTQTQAENGSSATKQALEIYIASHFRNMVTNPVIWDGVWARSLIVPEHRQAAERIVASHANVSESEVNEATERVKPLLADLRPAQALSMNAMPISGIVALSGFMFFIFVGLPGLVAAVLFRGGLLLHGLGIAVVTKDGSPASRWRVLWRGLIAWSPLLLSFVALSSLRANSVALVPIVVFVGAALWSLRTPERGVQDGLAGTRLVVR